MSAPELLTASELRWTLEPLAPDPIDDDPLIDVLLEAMAYRTLAQEAIHALAELRTEHRRVERRYHWLLHQRRPHR